jgi:3D (Asp-Asp-Asp) domain-containing protein
VPRRRQSRVALALAVVAGLLGATLPGAQGAGGSGRADTLRRQQAGLSARSHETLLSLYALDSRIAQTRAELARLRARAEALRLQRQRLHDELAIVAGNLRVSEQLLGNHLRALYEEGEPNAIAVLLGATSLDDAVTRLDELERSARQGADAVTDTRDGRARLRALSAEIAKQARETQALLARTVQTLDALASARAQRVAYLASLARQRRLTTRQIAALDSSAQQVVQRAETIQAQASVPSSAGAPVVGGDRSLTVMATGYSLEGQTATGLPAGPGVVAVDPSVIPLGTRMTIPGYGEGVAADTGSAVQGYAIDLWFPTLADALAWGRRTVTITLH